MMLYSLIINTECKNKKSIFYFSLLIIKFLDNVLKKHTKSIKNTSKFTLLRSPHVHKSAQHEFKQQVYKKQYLFVFCDNKKLIFLKKLFFFYFQDIRKNCTFITTANSNCLDCKFLKLKVFNVPLFLNNSSSLTFTVSKHKNHNKLSKLRNYLKLLNLKGEVVICDS